MSRPAAGPGISRCLLRQQTQMPSYSDCLVPCDVLSSFPIFLTPPPPHHLHRHRLSQSFRRLRSTFRRFTSAIFSFFLAAISAPLTSAPFHFFCSSPSARAVVPLNQNRQIAVPSFLLSGGRGMSPQRRTRRSKSDLFNPTASLPSSSPPPIDRTLSIAEWSVSVHNSSILVIFSLFRLFIPPP